MKKAVKVLHRQLTVKEKEIVELKAENEQLKKQIVNQQNIEKKAFNKVLVVISTTVLLNLASNAISVILNALAILPELNLALNVVLALVPVFAAAVILFFTTKKK